MYSQTNFTRLTLYKYCGVAGQMARQKDGWKISLDGCVVLSFFFVRFVLFSLPFVLNQQRRRRREEKKEKKK